MNPTFEQGPIRPPSEAASLLVRVSRNCPWNRCAFCRTYAGAPFSLRSVAEVRQDIDGMAEIAEDLRELSRQEGEQGRISERILALVFDRAPRYHEGHRAVALWLHWGGESAFLQDADPLAMDTDGIVSILHHLRAAFPSLKRITTYCRSKTAAHKPPEELRLMREAGLSRVHVGMESGADRVLKLIRKGAAAADHIEAGHKIKAAGISLCLYVIPGLGGALLSEEHARETARVIHEINPDFVRLRSLQVVPGTPLMEMRQQGEFSPLGDEDLLREIRAFIAGLTGIETTIVSDHILNLLEEIEGRLPGDRRRMLAVVDRYFSLSAEQRLVFRLGRRSGIYRRLADLSEPDTHARLKQIVGHWDAERDGSLERHLTTLASRYI
jgi:hypothetical protein